MNSLMKSSLDRYITLVFFFFAADVLADGLHQVCLAQTDPAINEKRVVGARRRLRDREAGGMSDFVVRTDHERFEIVARIEPERLPLLRLLIAANFAGSSLSASSAADSGTVEPVFR